MPHALAEIAWDYLRAAEHAHAGFNAPSWPTYHLAFHSLELFLKAHLARCGMSAETLKRMGHAIDKELIAAINNGLHIPAPAQLQEDAMRMSQYYKDHDFRYKRNGEWMLLEPPDLITYVRLVGDAVMRRDTWSRSQPAQPDPIPEPQETH